MPLTRPSRIALVVAVCVAAGAAAAAGYALTAPKRYRATALVLVQPVSPSDPTFAGIGVLRDTGGKRTAAASVAALLRGPQVAAAAAATLALKRSVSSLEHALSVRVAPGSDVVDVTAEDASATGAANLANTFVNVFISQRSADFQSQLTAAIKRDQQLLATTGTPKSLGAALTRRLITLKGFAGQPDPTVRTASEATAPAHASWPNVGSLVGIGTGIGAAVGLVAALALLALRGSARGYDRPVSDPSAERLVERLEARLAARESALAARERDVEAKLAELRGAAAAPQPERADDSELRRREADLGERVSAVTKREVEVARRAAALSVRERDLDARFEAAEELERELAGRSEEAARALAELEEARARPAPPPRAVAADGDGAYSLADLEELVARRGSRHPERVEEWQSYLFFLRDYAAPDGRIPASFDWLIAETFESIL